MPMGLYISCLHCQVDGLCAALLLEGHIATLHVDVCLKCQKLLKQLPIRLQGGDVDGTPSALALLVLKRKGIGAIQQCLTLCLGCC